MVPYNLGSIGFHTLCTSRIGSPCFLTSQEETWYFIFVFYFVLLVTHLVFNLFAGLSRFNKREKTGTNSSRFECILPFFGGMHLNDV